VNNLGNPQFTTNEDRVAVLDKAARVRLRYHNPSLDYSLYPTVTNVKWAKEVQRLLNEQGRRVTGCFRTTPQGALMNDAGLQPTKALLNNRVRRYKLRQMMMPDAQGGGRMLEIRRHVIQRVEGIDKLMPEDRPFERRSYERTTLSTERRSLKGKVIIQGEKQAMVEAKRERDGLVFWTDGSRKEDEWVGCAVVWKEEGRWKRRRIHLGRQKEAFDAEMYAMSEAMKIADEMAG